MHYPFRKIVCGIDGNPAALEAARQAALLADADTTLELVAISDERPAYIAAEPRPLLKRDDLARVLDVARRAIPGTARHVVTRALEDVDGYPWEALLDEAADADLVVLGRHPLTRAEGLLAGGMTANVFYRAEVPVLAAVEPPRGEAFPGRILVAAGGQRRPEDAVRLAGAIARRHGSEVVLVRVASERSPEPVAVAAAVAEVGTALGAEPREIVARGDPHHVIVDYAKREQASLVITGGAGLRELRPVGGVSERVAHEAPCSVLAIRDPGDPVSVIDWPTARAGHGFRDDEGA